MLLSSQPYTGLGGVGRVLEQQWLPQVYQIRQVCCDLIAIFIRPPQYWGGRFWGKLSLAGCELARLVPGCQGGDSAGPNRPRGRLCELDVPPTAARNGQFRAFAGGRDTPHEDAKLAAETWFGR